MVIKVHQHDAKNEGAMEMGWERHNGLTGRF